MFRQKLHKLRPVLRPSNEVNPQTVPKQSGSWCAPQESELLCSSTGRRRPGFGPGGSQTAVGVTLGGGGGTGYVFWRHVELEEAGLVPDVIAGASMGAIGCRRGHQPSFRCGDASLPSLSWSRVFCCLNAKVVFNPCHAVFVPARGDRPRVEAPHAYDADDMSIPSAVVAGSRWRRTKRR